MVGELKKLPHSDGTEQFLSPHTPCELSLLHTDRPRLSLGPGLFMGRFLPVVGTHLIFEIKENEGGGEAQEAPSASAAASAALAEEKQKANKKKKKARKKLDRKQATFLAKSYTHMTFILDKPQTETPVA